MRHSLLIIGAATIALAGCKTSKKPEQQAVIETIGTQPVYTSEFAYIYNKNNGNSENAYTRESLNEYLDLYTNFRLKVMEAESKGLDTTAAFKRELEGYRQQLAQPYLTEKSVTDKLVKQAYDRMQQEIRASHILLTLSPDADPKDTLAVYNQVMDLRKRIVAGEDFEKIASEYSQDPSAKDNKGDLGYFTALQMVYPFEDAAYNTPVGQVSQPVRTRFGYHLIKVKDKRQAQGEVKVAHIMVRAQPGMPKADSVAAKQKIDEIYKRVQKNEDWDKLVSQFSEDASSAQNGGELPWFGTGRMIPSFEEAAFALKSKGDVSQPILTPYGWHIIKLEDRRSLPAFEDMEPTLRSKVAKDSRSELNRAAFLKRIKQENNFTENADAKTLVLNKADQSLLAGNWQPNFSDKEKNMTLFSIKDKKYTVQDFVNYVQNSQKPGKNTSAAHAMQLMYDGFAESSLINYEKENLENKYVDYRMLVKEYRDGILLFQLMDEKVWSKAIEDTAGLRAYFNANRDKYMWDTRAKATVVSAANPDVLAKAKSMMDKGTYTGAQTTLSDVNFEAGKATAKVAKPSTSPAKNERTAQLQDLVTKLKSDTTLTVELIGSADTREVKRNAASLANKRAEEVKKELTDKGIAAARITVRDGGQVSSGKTETARKQNRSVSYVLSSDNLAFLQDILNQENPLAIQISQRKFQKGDNKVLDDVKWEKGTYNVEKDGRFYLIKIEEILPPTQKTLNEARGIATSDYQTYLEKEWVENLRK
ncbi:MAG: peptidylprolyl isomerase, partial [Hymenobacteraceae bacterium]|nr:peptidylprolyl isomerase [Hymenobacteraceae bacterium]MDX5396014.1 peptidylprolyl isomerase [Hymenobacteraceae bacterium]MDX5442155.1 peptidylprolyl isomerase [Hymenobacteraceae bacterium]MDX5512075.1 peptidylprolyl isomerase [Hymenobacteraceae bacterium]